MKEQHYSANFKKDYMAYFAIGLFFVIVIIELYMAIWLPIYLKSQNRWAIQESRQEMIDRFDGLRRTYSKLKPATKQGKTEIAVIVNCLNNNAIYLREYQMQMNIDQIRALNSDYQTVAIFLRTYRRKDKKSKKHIFSLGTKRQLQTEPFMNKLKKQAATKLKMQVQQYKKNGYIE